MTLRIDPRYPVVWRSPSSVQIGVDSPVIRLSSVNRADECLLAALRRGTTRRALDAIGSAAGASLAQVGSFLNRVSGALIPQRFDDAPEGADAPAGTLNAHALEGKRITVSGAPAATDEISRAFRLLGAIVAPGAIVTPGAIAVPGAIVTPGASVGTTSPALQTDSAAPSSLATPINPAAPNNPIAQTTGRGQGSRREQDSRPELAIVVSAFTVLPATADHWLRRDVPHLAVVFGDSRVSVGPLVVPGRGPCLNCITRWRTEDDAAWPAIAGQLMHQSASADNRLTIFAVLPVVIRAAIAGVSADPEAAVALGGLRTVISAEDGECQTERIRQHPDCLCADEDFVRHGTGVNFGKRASRGTSLASRGNRPAGGPAGSPGG